ncbi:hypothetical protein T4D_10413 [Trichinella pseudospiralis]|uniref:Uncharacterized protein n=1 Tax=Trichinella pseudospiralis TaxID=6337 RepID=A0A0V1F6Y1_TRIPS|nr:hypothetical protein T4D_7476 [Trichinella pseudospiralis]KRY81959.1 hypothetical protein T4D_6707 [Trichinella pseudospiralis]KRY81962.1 hypothetical protein T4D_10413 [Trichinella pseudospiralis]
MDIQILLNVLSSAYDEEHYVMAVFKLCKSTFSLTSYFFTRKCMQIFIRVLSVCLPGVSLDGYWCTVCGESAKAAMKFIE